MDLQLLRTRKRLRRIAKRLTRFTLQRPEGDDFGLSAEITDSLFRRDRLDERFLGYYTQPGLSDALEQYGVFPALRAKGFDPVVRTRPLDLHRHELTLSDADGTHLAELLVRRARLAVDETLGPLVGGQQLDMLVIEWLMLNNPHKEFSEERPPLPGQVHPGLGLGRIVFSLLEIMAERLELQALLGFPEHYHNAVLYHPGFRFLSPERAGEMKALQRDVGDLGLAGLSWAIDQELVWDRATRVPYLWKGEEMMRPITAPVLEQALSSEAYAERARHAAERHFDCDRDQAATLLRAVRAGKIRG